LAFGDKNASWVRRDIIIDMAGFAPTPIMPIERAEGGLKILLDGDTAEGFDGEPFDALQIVGPIQAERNAIHAISPAGMIGDSFLNREPSSQYYAQPNGNAVGASGARGHSCLTFLSAQCPNFQAIQRIFPTPQANSHLAAD
jgi:hypothetical protein